MQLRNILKRNKEKKQMSEQREQGTAKWFKNTHGFITRDNGEIDCFLHHTGIRDEGKYRTVNEGDRVEFTVVQTEKGPQAADLIVLAPAPKP